MTKSCEIRVEARARVLFSDGNYEQTFLFSEHEDGVTIADVPVRSRTHLSLLGGWHVIPTNLPTEELRRIHSQLVQYFLSEGKQAKVIGELGGGLFRFFPELIGFQSRALELLESKGFAFMRDFTSVGALHDRYGLEICGIPEEARILPIARIMQEEFPHFHYGRCSYQGSGREPGWKLCIYMIPGRCAGGDCEKGDS